MSSRILAVGGVLSLQIGLSFFVGALIAYKITQVRSSASNTFRSEGTKPFAVSQAGNSTPAPRPVGPFDLVQSERDYRYPQLRVSQLKVLLAEGEASYFSRYLQDPVLRLPWLLLLVTVTSSDRADNYYSKAGELLGESAIKSEFLASARSIKLSVNKRVESVNELRGVFREQFCQNPKALLTRRDIGASALHALSTEAARLDFTKDVQNSWILRDYLAATGPDRNHEPITNAASSNPTATFEMVANLGGAIGYDAGSTGVRSGGFFDWMQLSLRALEAGQLTAELLALPLSRWAIYEPSAALAWSAGLDSAKFGTLQIACGQSLALNHRAVAMAIELSKYPSTIATGIFRGLIEFDPVAAHEFASAPRTPSTSFAPAEYSRLASALSYIRPDLAHSYHKIYVAAQIKQLGTGPQNFDAVRTSNRVYAALADISPATAIESAMELPQFARANALVHLVKCFILKQEREANSRALRLLNEIDHGSFRSAAALGYGMQPGWDILAGFKLEEGLQEALRTIGRSHQGEALPRLTK